MSSDLPQPLLLVADTALGVATVGLCRGGQVLVSAYMESKRDHAERIMSCVDELMAQSGTQLADIDAFVVGRGPGSFIGVRIAVSTFKGLAMGLERPLVGVSTAEALALSSSTDSPWAIAIDAKKGQVYAAAYRVGQQHAIDVIMSPTALSPQEASRRFVELGCVSGLGGGFARYDVLGATLNHVDSADRIHAQALALLAVPRIKDRDIDDLDSLVPDYVRRSEAELKRGL